jgi:hypothetical protein
MDNLNLLVNSNTLYEGYVADNKDPDNFGRVRVHIRGRTEGITDTEKLPFARVLHPLNAIIDRTDTPPEVGTEVLLMMVNTMDYNSLIILGGFKMKNQTV